MRRDDGAGRLDRRVVGGLGRGRPPPMRPGLRSETRLGLRAVAELVRRNPEIPPVGDSQAGNFDESLEASLAE